MPGPLDQGGRPISSLVVSTDGAGTWTFLTNHTHVLLCIHRDPAIRLREVATLVGITERAAQKIVADLAEAGYLAVERVGRRNQYTVRPRQPLRHPLERTHLVGELLELLAEERVRRSSRARA